MLIEKMKTCFCENFFKKQYWKTKKIGLSQPKFPFKSFLIFKKLFSYTFVNKTCLNCFKFKSPQKSQCFLYFYTGIWPILRSDCGMALMTVSSVVFTVASKALIAMLSMTLWSGVDNLLLESKIVTLLPLLVKETSYF
jgi:hypothetical protein